LKYNVFGGMYCMAILTEELQLTAQSGSTWTRHGYPHPLSGPCTHIPKGFAAILGLRAPTPALCTLEEGNAQLIRYEWSPIKIDAFQKET
jgi:hypothetical protein